jgi:hypothetical protein
MQNHLKPNPNPASSPDSDSDSDPAQVRYGYAERMHNLFNAFSTLSGTLLVSIAIRSIAIRST